MTYAAQIDALIPEAERMAYAEIGPWGGEADGQGALEWAERWNRAFHAAMDRLARARGLRKPAASPGAPDGP